MPAKFVPIDHDSPMLLPPDLRNWVEANHMVNFIMDAVNALDLSEAGVNERGAGSPCRASLAMAPSFPMTLPSISSPTGISLIWTSRPRSNSWRWSTPSSHGSRAWSPRPVKSRRSISSPPALQRGPRLLILRGTIRPRITTGGLDFMPPHPYGQGVQGIILRFRLLVRRT